MLPPLVGIKVETAGAVETAQPLVLILHGVGMDDVHNHGDSHLMGPVDEALQLLRSAEA